METYAITGMMVSFAVRRTSIVVSAVVFIPHSSMMSPVGGEWSTNIMHVLLPVSLAESSA